MHVVGLRTEADLDAVKTDLFGECKSADITRLANGPVTRADAQFWTRLCKTSNSRQSQRKPRQDSRALQQSSSRQHIAFDGRFRILKPGRNFRLLITRDRLP